MRKTLILAAGLSLLACSSASAATTKTHIYDAFESGGQPGITIEHTYQGSCMGGSNVLNRSDAWRCISGNALADPCFSSSKSAKFVLCPSAPWKESGIKIKLLQKLKGGHKRAPSTKGNPWGIQTTTGLKCGFAGGATAAIGSKRANYACVKSSQWLWGSPIRSSATWTIFIAPLNAKKLSKRAKIAVAWF